MKDYGVQRSTERPEAIVIDEYSVWVHCDIVKVEENVGLENEFIGYAFNMKQYLKDEYILEVNGTTADEITRTQLALCEVYEALL